MTPNSNLAEVFAQYTYPKFHHPMFTCLEVIVLTNKQTLLKTPNALRYATTSDKDEIQHLLIKAKWH